MSVADLIFKRFRLVLGAVIVAIFPPIWCLLFTKDIKLTRAQNTVDAKDLSGRPTGEPTLDERTPSEAGMSGPQRID